VSAVNGAGRRVYLVESYVPRLDGQTAEEIGSRVQAAVRELNGEGVDLRWLRSFALFGEETVISVVHALALEDVVALNARVDRVNDHVVEAVAIEA
jgi:hypothetical protein